MRSHGFAAAPAVESLESRTLLSAAAAEVFHVSVSGHDAGEGSQDSPWRTLQHAANRVGAGDTVIVHAGTYAGFDLRTDGTAEQRITFQAEDGVLINQRNAITTDGINLEGADYVTIQGFQIVGVPRAGIRSVVNHHVIIQDNVLDQNGVWGIFTAFSDDVLIEDNITSRSVKQHGIYVSNSGDRPTIRGNEIWGNYQNGIHMNGDISAGGDGIISGALVEQNEIYDNGRGGGSGINADGIQNSRFANNLLYNNHASGMALYRINAGGGSSGNTVVNNTILNAADGRWAITISDGSINNTLLNNIIYNAHSSRGSITVASDSLSGLVSDYNIVIDRFSTDGGGNRLTLSQWQAATGQDRHSIIATPSELFVDPAGGIFELLAGSPAIDAGIAQSAPAVDFAGDSRPQGAGIDIGADEFLVLAPPPPPPPQQEFSAGFDFGTSTSPVAPGYQQVTGGSVYDSSKGYGWTSAFWTGDKDRGGADPLTRDSIFTQVRSFAADLPDGIYDVTITIGDVANASDNLSVSLEGQEAGTISAGAGEHASATFRVEVTDGQLSIDLQDLGGQSKYFFLNAIKVQSAGGPVQDQTGPRVIATEFLGEAANALTGVRISFSEAIPEGGLALSHLTLAGPNGPILPTSLTRLSSTEFEVQFPVQSAEGRYTLTVLPLIVDQAGNLLDQDGDGTGGELLEDQVQAIAELFATDFQSGFDFGTTTSPVAPGYQQVTWGSMYDSSKGYGWTSAFWTGDKDRGGADPLTRDSIFTQVRSFAADLPDGIYDVTITIGDVANVSDNLSVSLEGQEAGIISAGAGEHASATYRAEVTDGQLSIDLQDLGGQSKYFFLNAIKVQSAGGPVQDQTGPRVIATEFLGEAANALTGVRISFSEDIPEGGLALSHLTLAGPNGPILPTSLTRLSSTEFEVQFPVQSAEGRYTLTVIPLVTDQAGNLLDQDGDGTGGELLEDQVQAIAELFATDFQSGFDFGTTASPVAPGYQQVTWGSVYDSSKGFGWTSAFWTGDKDRGGADPLTRDSIFTQVRSFAADLPDGIYDVTITIGDVANVSDNLSVSLEGQEAGTISAGAGEHASATFRVEVTDGQLSIDLQDLGGQSKYFFLNAIQVQKV